MNHANPVAGQDDTIDAQLERAAAAIRAGQPVAMPTETVYGLAADATRPDAVARVYELKARPRFDPLIVHVNDIATAESLASTVNNAAVALMNAFWPGPLTIVMPRRDVVPDIVTAGLPTVAIRCPAHPLARRLIDMAGVPLAAPSANRFGRISPTTAAHVRDEFGDDLPIVDGGPCQWGLESTVISLAGSVPTLLRHGSLSREDIEAIIGPVETTVAAADKPLAPGMTPRHYAPRTPLVLVRSIDEARSAIAKAAGGRASRSGSDTAAAATSSATSRAASPPLVALLAFDATTSDLPADLQFAAVETLSPDGDLIVAASRLFGCMRHLDALGVDLIIAIEAPERGLGMAINDRLSRASHPDV